MLYSVSLIYVFVHHPLVHLQGNIRVFCRVRPLVDGGPSEHIQLSANDNKMLALAKTEEVRSIPAAQIVALQDNKLQCSSNGNIVMT